MKRKITKIRPDGSKEIIEEHDEAPQMHKTVVQAKQAASKPDPQDAYLQRMMGKGQPMPMQQVAAQGQKGDTQLAHVNNYEAMLLKMLGGAGTRNPRTGLKQFYIDPNTGLENGLPGVAPAATAQTPGTFNLPMDIAPYSLSNSVSGGQNTSTGLGLNQATNQSNQGSYSLGTNAAQNTSNQGSVNNATNQAQNTAFNNAQNTAQQQAQNTAFNNAQNTNLSTAQNTANQLGYNVGQQGSLNTGIQGSETSGSNFARNTANNYSGLDPAIQAALMKVVTPQLTGAVKNMSGNYDAYTNQALDSYQNMLQNALRQQIPTTLAGLTNRGILSSAAGNKVLSDVMSNAAISASDKGYQTAMQQALLKANMPAVLAQIAQLGQFTKGASSGESGGQTAGSSFGNTLGTSYGNTLGMNTGTSQGTSLGVGQGTSTGGSQGTSSGISQGTSLGGSQGTSSGQSTGSSFGNSQGDSYGQQLANSFGNSSGQSTGLNLNNAQGTNYENSNAYSTDPTVMYRQMADLIKGMM